MKNELRPIDTLRNDRLKALRIKKYFLSIFLLFLIYLTGSGFYAANACPNINDVCDTITSIMLKNTIPYTLPWDDVPVDLSFIYKDEKPAGKHGFLKVKGDRFVFEDGSEARFWGTVINCAQNFPSHEHSEKLAKRLAKVGINIVRLHQLDAEWATPNIFQFTKGENKSNTMSFDPESMDRLDYLIYCLRQEGIYIYMDLLSRRIFKTGDGIEEAAKLHNNYTQGAAKPYSTFNRKMIELQKKYSYDLFSHINPYTKLAYKDDPAISVVGITNENDVFSRKVTMEPYRTEFEELFRGWAAKENLRIGQGNVDFDPSDKYIRDFLIDMTRDYYQEMIGHMRELGVKIPIMGNNWSKGTAHLYAQMVTDFTDSHGYGNTDVILKEVAGNRVSGKPLFVSEWCNSWPNERRSETPLLMAAVGAFQGWGGITIHTYRYSLDEDVDMIAKPITSGALGGIPFRSGKYDTFNDPALFGLFYHAALIMRRGDVKPAEKTVLINILDLDTEAGDALHNTLEKHRVENVLPGMKGKGDIMIGPDENIVDVSKGEIMSDTRELYRNFINKTGWIDTPNTKAVYGFVGNEGDMALTNLNINVKTDFATVVISTLTDDPIKRSDNMLLTAVGRADNTDSRYKYLEGGNNQQLDIGHGPVRVEIIQAKIEIETDKPNLRVMAINSQGGIIGYIPSEYKEGKFRFEIGKEFSSMYYLIQNL